MKSLDTFTNRFRNVQSTIKYHESDDTPQKNMGNQHRNITFTQDINTKFRRYGKTTWKTDILFFCLVGQDSKHTRQALCVSKQGWTAHVLKTFWDEFHIVCGVKTWKLGRDEVDGQKYWILGSAFSYIWFMICLIVQYGIVRVTMSV